MTLSSLRRALVQTPSAAILIGIFVFSSGFGWVRLPLSSVTN